jgi:hypothetical protein
MQRLYRPHIGHIQAIPRKRRYEGEEGKTTMRKFIAAAAAAAVAGTGARAVITASSAMAS